MAYCKKKSHTSCLRTATVILKHLNGFSKIVNLAHSYFNKTFTLDNDASDYGIGGVLVQTNEQCREQPVAYFNYTLLKPDRRYAVTRKEMLAVLVAKTLPIVRTCRRIFVRTDHSALQWLRNIKKLVKQMAHLLKVLVEYNFEIVHRAGKIHANANGLSRINSTLATVTEVKQSITPSLKTKFCQEQKQDALTLLLLEWLIKAERPDDDEMEGTSWKLRYYLERLNKLLIQDEILRLLNNSIDGATTTFWAIVPKRARQRILKLAYSSAGRGHFGIHKIVNMLKQHFHWKLMTRNIRDWCE